MAKPARGQDCTLFITVDGWREPVAALTGVSINDDLESLPAANPTSYGSSWAVPGMRGWAASATNFILLGDSISERDTALREIRAAQRAGRYVTVTVAWPDGAEETGQAIVTGIERQMGLNSPISGSFQFQGVGELEES